MELNPKIEPKKYNTPNIHPKNGIIKLILIYFD